MIILFCIISSDQVVTNFHISKTPQNSFLTKETLIFLGQAMIFSINFVFSRSKTKVCFRSKKLHHLLYYKCHNNSFLILNRFYVEKALHHFLAF